MFQKNCNFRNDPNVATDELMQAERRLFLFSPLPFLALAFASGIGFAYLLPFRFIPVAITAFLILIILSFFTSRRFFILLSFFAFFVIGILAGINGQTTSKQDIAFAVAQGNVVLEGTVANVPEKVVKGRKETVSFVLECQSVYRMGSIYAVQGKVQIFLYNPKHPVSFGEKLRLRGVIETPSKARNPYSIDYAHYLARQGIFRVFRGVGKFSIVRQGSGNGNCLMLAANRFRACLKEHLDRLFPSPYRELASALLLGFRKNISRGIQDAFIKTGTAHLLAISGLHISLVGGLFYFLGRFLRIPRAVNLILTIAFMTLYTILAGANMPVLRAGIMGVVILFGVLIGRDRNIRQAFFFALFALLVWSPNALLSASFQLSFVAIASLIFLLPELERLLSSDKEEMKSYSLLVRFSRNVHQTFLASVAVTVGMFPILVWYFSLFSLVGLLANLVAIPVCTMGIAFTFPPLVMDWIYPPFAHVLSLLPLLFFKFELWFVELSARFQLGYFYVPHPPWFLIIVYYGFLGLWIFSMRRPAHRWFRVSIFVALVISTLIFFPFCLPRKFHITFFDLGKNDAAFVSFSNGTNCLINSGRQFPSDQAYWILRPFLMASGVRKIDGLLFTHLDGQHSAGFLTLVRHFQFQKVLVPMRSMVSDTWRRYLHALHLNGAPVTFVTEGSRVLFGPDAEVEILNSPRNEPLALYLRDSFARVLYLASVQPAVFEALAAQPHLNCDVVFLPAREFGISKIEQAFLRRVSPRFIVLNERDNVNGVKRQLKTVVGSQLLFMKELGAIEFYRKGNALIYRTSLSPSGQSYIGAQAVPVT